MEPIAGRDSGQRLDAIETENIAHGGEATANGSSGCTSLILLAVTCLRPAPNLERIQGWLNH
jgi:hypothetical protein